MRHLGRGPVRLDDARLVAAIGPEPRTPPDEAARETLAAPGCLSGPAAGGSAGRAPRTVLLA